MEHVTAETMPIPLMAPWAKTFEHSAAAAYEVTRHDTNMLPVRVVGDELATGETQFVVQRKAPEPGPLGIEWQTLTKDGEWAFYVHLGLEGK